MTHFSLKPPSGPISGELRMPGDKSLLQRAIIFALLADGVSTLSGFDAGLDCHATLQACGNLGAEVSWLDDVTCQIKGTWGRGLRAPDAPLDLGNSGTGLRLLAGVIASHDVTAILQGDESLLQRPMGRIVQPLMKMGAHVETCDNRPPLTIRGSACLRGIHYTMPIASAQLQSCLVLAALHAEGETILQAPAASRDHTQRMLKAIGYPHRCDKNRLSIVGGARIQAHDWLIPGDLSCAAFCILAAAITPQSDLQLIGVGVNPTRTGFLDILIMMGASLVISNVREQDHERVADIRVRYAPLTGVRIPQKLIVSALDEFPCCCIAAATASGVTEFRYAQELRVKESDRIHAMVQGLRLLGIKVEEFPDGVTITGGKMHGAVLESFGDHRIAMAFAVAMQRAEGEIFIRNCDNVVTSYPNFAAHALQIGINISQITSQDAL